MGWSLESKTLGYIIFKERKTIISELEESLTGAKIEQSDTGMKNNPGLLQASEVANYDADLTAGASKIIEED